MRLLDALNTLMLQVQSLHVHKASLLYKHLYMLCEHFVGQVISGSWDKTLKCWDPRGASSQERTLVGTYTQPERVYSLSLVGNRVVVATAGRHVNIYDLRNMSQPEQQRESSLKYQTRCVQCYPNGTGIFVDSCHVL